MANKTRKKKTSALSIAMTSTDRALIDRAACFLGLPPSTWSRTVLLEKSAEVISDKRTAAK